MSNKGEAMRDKMPATTADKLYGERAAQIRAELVQLHKALDGHAARKAARPGDYGYAGDLGRALQCLHEAAHALGLKE
jgi:hypothetical protein